MLCITKELENNIEHIEYTGYKKEVLIFFDIETTGIRQRFTLTEI